MFANHGDAGHDTRRRSLLHVGGAHARPRVRELLREARERAGNGGRIHDLLGVWDTAFEEICAARLRTPEDFEESVWETYKTAMCNENYYFSPSEIWLFALLTQTPVVLTMFQHSVFRINGGHWSNR